MKSRFACLLALASAACAFTTSIGGLGSTTPGNIVSNKFIIEVASVSDVPSKRGEKAHASVYESLRKRDVKIAVDKEYNTQGIFVGAAVTLNDSKDLEQLMNTPGVLAVHPVRFFPAPNPIQKDGIDDADKVAADLQSTHVVTHVDKLHEEGILGDGIKIGIIDTGTDYTHPALGGGFGPGHVIAGGTDLVGDAFNGTNTPVPDNDPLDQCVGHGTHVAGIIAAQPGNEFNITGVAYKSSIYSYRIFGCTGGTSDDMVIEGLLRAYNDGMDVVTLSLGGPSGWTESPSSVTAARIANSGRVVTIAAGNDGQSGAWFPSSPGDGLGPISVASTDNIVVGFDQAIPNGSPHAPLLYTYDAGGASPLPVPGNATLPVYATSLVVNPLDACQPLPDDTPDLSKYLVLYQRGGSCPPNYQFGYLADKGAQYLMAWTPENVTVNGTSSQDVLPRGHEIFSAATLGATQLNRRQSIAIYSAILYNNSDGAWLTAELASGKNVSLTFPQQGERVELPDPTGGLVSYYSSYGPTFDMRFKPAIAAPGGNILSTWPTTMGTWKVLSGTSMATPFLAGVTALLLQAHGKSPSVATGALALLETTAQPLLANHTGDPSYQTLAQQGAGLVDAYKAVHTTTIVTPGELLLNDTAHFTKNQDIHVQNNGKSAAKYMIGHIPAGTALTFNGSVPALGPVPLSASAASVKFSTTSVVVPPGGNVKVTATFSPPTGLDASQYPVYSGWITITSGSEALQIPYLGAAATLKDKEIFDTTEDLFNFPTPTLANSTTGGPVTGPSNYTLVGDDVPLVLFRTAFGSPVINLDLVAADINFTPTLSKRVSYSGVKTLGNLDSEVYLPRNNLNGENPYYSTLINGTFANGTEIPKGSYKVLLRALRVNGDASKEDDYDSWLSPVIGLF